jgi:hypothetical protein
MKTSLATALLPSIYTQALPLWPEGRTRRNPWDQVSMRSHFRKASPEVSPWTCCVLCRTTSEQTGKVKGT